MADAPPPKKLKPNPRGDPVLCATISTSEHPGVHGTFGFYHKTTRVFTQNINGRVHNDMDAQAFIFFPKVPNERLKFIFSAISSPGFEMPSHWNTDFPKTDERVKHALWIALTRFHGSRFKSRMSADAINWIARNSDWR